MDNLSTTPALTTDLPAYVAHLAARVDRLEQSTRPLSPHRHGHSFGHNKPQDTDDELPQHQHCGPFRPVTNPADTHSYSAGRHTHYGSVPSLHHP